MLFIEGRKQAPRELGFVSQGKFREYLCSRSRQTSGIDQRATELWRVRLRFWNLGI